MSGSAVSRWRGGGGGEGADDDIGVALSSLSSDRIFSDSGLLFLASSVGDSYIEVARDVCFEESGG